MYWALIISADIWGPSVSTYSRVGDSVRFASIQCALGKTFNKHSKSQQICNNIIDLVCCFSVGIGFYGGWSIMATTSINIQTSNLERTV